MDKVGRMLGFPFPAGRHIDALAQTYDSSIHLNIPKFPVFSPKGSDDFSFSGLKSAALREIQSRGVLNEIDTVEIAYAYQKTITDTLSHELIRAHEKYGTQSIGLVG